MTLAEELDTALRGKRPSQVVLVTIGAMLSLKVACKALDKGHLIRRTFKLFLRGVRQVAKPIIQQQVIKASKGIKLPSKEGELKTIVLPPQGHTYDEVIRMVETFHEDLDLPFRDGKLSGAVYHGGEEHTKFINKVMEIQQWSNPLHSDVFGATRKMEAEIVSMVMHMFNGQILPDACGTLTSGGSESIMMAMKTYRDWGRKERGIDRPSVLAPITIHPAFDKAAEYFDINLIKIPVKRSTMAVEAAEMEKYIRYDTVAIVGSACSFPHGIIDPIEELSEVALRHDVGLHVDSCLGGFMIPFLERTGRKVPVIDFRNKGVTSISCDTHKYGYGPKGTSTVLYRTKQLRSYQFCSVSEWPGGMYCSPGVSGSKPGNVIAATWASMVHLGMAGYVRCCNEIMNVREFMTSELQTIPYLYIMGKPEASVFAFSSEEFDIFEMSSELMKRGWMLNRLQFPSGLQFSVTMLQTMPGVAKKFIEDVREVGDALYAQAKDEMQRTNKKAKTGETGGSMYGSAQRVPDRTIIQDVLKEYLNAYYTP
eukprot:gene5973-4282_t